ncbi:hypothetical protein BGX38DRAFT_847462 [Terfezia claveryi]|nr:hypothetical protein BGX38DRAFT_847462 [Terfezia claveryi]
MISKTLHNDLRGTPNATEVNKFRDCLKAQPLANNTYKSKSVVNGSVKSKNAGIYTFLSDCNHQNLFRIRDTLPSLFTVESMHCRREEPESLGLRLSETLPSILWNLPTTACWGIFTRSTCANMDSRPPPHSTNHPNGTFSCSRLPHNHDRPELHAPNISVVQ